MDTLNLLTQQLFSRTQNFQAANFDSRTDTSYGTDTFDALIRRKSDSGTVSTAKKSADTSDTSETDSSDNTVVSDADNRDNSVVTDNAVREKPEHAEKVEKPVIQNSGDEDDNLVLAVGLVQTVRPEIQYADTFENAALNETVPEVNMVLTSLVDTEVTENVSLPEIVSDIGESLENSAADTAGSFTVVTESVIPENAAAEKSEISSEQPSLLSTEPQTEQTDYVSETTVAADTDNLPDGDNTLTEYDDEESDKLLQDGDKDAGTSVPLFENDRATPVKVAEPVRETVNIEAEDAIEQLADKLGASIETDYNKVEITLSPASLGKLTVEITRTENGVISIVMHTTNAKTAALLERGTSNLQNIIAANTGTDVKVEVQKSDGTENRYLNPNDQQDSGRQGQQEQPKKRKQSDTMDFMQKLRLGLVGLDGAAV